jgi:multidrug efflux pump subunit AcrA (membrane-fusion protein)
MKKTVIKTALVVVVTLVALMVFVRLTTGKELRVMNFGEAQRGSFEISVSATGELAAENSVDIKGPNIVQNRNFRSAGIKIVDLVPEGTEVKKGDYIATLDKSAFSNTLKDEMDNLKTIQADLEMKILDTAVTLSTLRDEIKNQTFTVEEASIVVDQSKYEPPAVQRKAELALDREQRLLNQDRKLYKLRYAQTLSEIRVLKSNLEIQRSKVNDLQEILAGFTITAPSDGMVIYKKDRLGVKNKTGTTLNPWNPVVATLPDLSDMLSSVYISEIDISKVKTGQPVQIAIDAFQGKAFTGRVASIANIGEQLSNSDSKVFEVLIKIDGSDPLLRPSMTTANKVITQTFDDVIYVPFESVHAGVDSVPFVYTEEGTKQVVILGESNDKNIIIEQGLNEGESVWLMTPENPDKFTLAGNDLIPIIKEREKARRIENERVKRENELITESKSATKSFTLGTGEGGATGSVGAAGGN